MNIPRVGHASFALSGRIYVVGGMDGKVPKTAKTSMSWVILLGSFGWSMSMVKCWKIQEVLKMCVEFFVFFCVASFFIHQFFDFYFSCGAFAAPHWVFIPDLSLRSCSGGGVGHL